MMSHTTFIRKQSNEYQQTTIKLKNLETTLEHQQIIQSNRIIPKQYQCKLLKTFDTSLTERFNQEHSNLFFQQLDCAITSNSINVELLKARLTSIVIQTEQELSTLCLSQGEVSTLYIEFLKESKIEDRIPIPVLRAKIGSNKTTTASPTTAQPKRKRPKRKLSAKAPEPKKCRTEDHFLCPGPQHSQQQS